MQKAIALTFERRGTDLPTEAPFALTQAFATDPAKQIQWNAFLRKNRLAANSLEEVITKLHQFLGPILVEKNLNKTWNPESGWTEKSP